MTITAEQIVQRMNEAFNCAEAASPEDAAQSILDTIRAEATAAAYGAAGAIAADRCAACGVREISGLVKEHIIRGTPADATAWLAARDAAQFKAGQEAAIKGAVKGWAVVTEAGKVLLAGCNKEGFGRLLDGETIRPCLILVGEGE